MCTRHLSTWTQRPCSWCADTCKVVRCFRTAVLGPCSWIAILCQAILCRLFAVCFGHAGAVLSLAAAWGRRRRWMPQHAVEAGVLALIRCQYLVPCGVFICGGCDRSSPLCVVDPANHGEGGSSPADGDRKHKDKQPLPLQQFARRRAVGAAGGTSISEADLRRGPQMLPVWRT